MSAVSRSTVSLETSVVVKSGIRSTITLKVRSALPSTTSSTLPTGSTRGCNAGLSLLSAIAFWLPSLTACSTTSPITDLPNCFLRKETGALPGRKPLRFTRGFISSRRLVTLASSSLAGTVTVYWRRRSSETVWVICMSVVLTKLSVGTMARIFLCRGPAATLTLAGPWHSSGPLRAPLEWCGQRDLNPHDFRHWNLNPARLPVPPCPHRPEFLTEIRLGAGPYSRGFGGLLGLESKRLQIGRNIPEAAEFPANFPVNPDGLEAERPMQ